jgi:hypothetical protein
MVGDRSILERDMTTGTVLDVVSAQRLTSQDADWVLARRPMRSLALTTIIRRRRKVDEAASRPFTGL